MKMTNIYFSRNWLLITILITSASVLMQELRKPRKLIIDTDAGSDDALAILLALKYEAAYKENIKIIAITCTYGNTEEENVEKNILKTLTIAKRNGIPVYGGAKKPLLRNFNGSKVYGKDGLGDFEFTEEITAKIDRSKHASLALIDLVKLNSGEINIITLGSLTNLALAITIDSTFMNHVDELFIMGSSVSGFGNECPNVEFNFAADPESNFIVMNSIKKPCILLPWETVYNCNPGKEWRTNVFGKLNSSSVIFLNKAEAVFFCLSNNSIWTGVDGLAIAIAIWPEIVKKYVTTNVTPVYDGAARGSVLVDYFNLTRNTPNAKIVQEYDLELYKAKLLQYFSDSCASVIMQKLGKPRKFIIDTDAGSDDALGILLALKCEAADERNIEIIAITCTYGNTEEKNVEKNVLKTLTIAKRNDIPVYGGAENSLLKNFIGSKFFGNDGFGDFEFPEKLTSEIARSKHAALALIELVKSYSGEVSIIALGPLTNLALAITLDSTFINHVDELIIMGSSVSEISNKSSNIEFNFSADPESNYIVMNSIKKPCMLLPLETALNSPPGKEWRQNVFGKLNSSIVDFLNKAETISSSKITDWTGDDALAVAVAIWPEMITHFLITNVTPVYGRTMRGAVLVDYQNLTSKPKNAKIVQSFDLDFFKSKLLNYVP
ncbi:uncharacterized protein LOC117183076 [Belonocnema kinseyi]|uniref:uncharacterized protein LOC117183076 n=1 Tax=Belonocnema kinseyi TaxID=2817044 RepID=UPI00143CC422|nr:uncharacterized protein LOC117183076 [Belonocnema kinseyi]